jgi:GMP synthase-like glutamine amidotransferase
MMTAKQLNMLVLQHEQCSSLGMLKNAVSRNNVPIRYLNTPEHERLSEPLTTYSHIVILGGAASAYEDEIYPSLKYEFQLVERAISAHIPIVGICLGSQILAKVLGAKVYRGEVGREVGWCDITLLDSANYDPLLNAFPKQFKVFQFHQDTFEIPAHGVGLAKSDRYPNQAFRYGDFVWAIQFHLDMDEQVIRDCSNALTQGLENSEIYHVTVEQMINEGKEFSPVVQPLADEFMEQFLRIT